MTTSEKTRTVKVGRRNDGRISAEFVVAFGKGAAGNAALAGDLSEGGMFVVSDDHVAIGEEVLVCFTLPDGRDIRALAEVRWLRDASPFRDEEKGFGVRFRDLTDEDRTSIGAWLESQKMPLKKAT